MKPYFLAFLFLFILKNSLGQVMFQKTYGGYGHDVAYHIALTSDSGYIMAGFSNSFRIGNYGGGAYILKVNSLGNIQWTRASIEGVGEFIQPTSDGGYIMGGLVYSPYKAYLLKIDSIGNTLWEKMYGGTSSEVLWSLCQTSDSGYALIGHTYSFGNANGDIYILRTNSNGDLIWSRTYGQGQGNSIHENSDGSFTFSGYTTPLAKIDSSGNILWNKTYTNTNNYYSEGWYSRHTSDNGYILFATVRPDYMVDSIDIYLVKTDSNGNALWGKSYGGNRNELPRDVKQTSDGGYVIVSSTNTGNRIDYDILVIKTNSLGDTLWTKVYGGTNHELLGSIEQTPDNGYIIAGETDIGGTRGEDVYLIKTDANGKSNCFEHSAQIKVRTLQMQTLNTTIQSIVRNSFTDSITTLDTVGGKENTLCFKVEINEIENQTTDINIYPNPATNHFTISFPKAIKGELTIFNMIGEKVYSEAFSGKEKRVDVKLNEGIYFVRVKDEERQSAGGRIRCGEWTEKVVIQ